MKRVLDILAIAILCTIGLACIALAGAFLWFVVLPDSPQGWGRLFESLMWIGVAVCAGLSIQWAANRVERIGKVKGDDA